MASYTSSREPLARFGLTVSRKVGNAVVRNRVKRALREGLRRRPVGDDRDGMRPLDALSYIDVVFIARSTAGAAPAELLTQEVVEAVQRIRAARKAT